MAGFLLATDFSVPLQDVRSFHHALVIFPHADDEAVTCGGVLHRLARGGCIVTLMILTKGERGTPRAARDSRLMESRTREAQAVAAILGISKLIQEDFGDGELRKKKLALAAFIETTIEQEKPDLLITYDLAGMYGHTDHIACSQVITELRNSRFRDIPLWYVTLPKRVLARTRLPEHMATDPHAQGMQALPTNRIFIGGSVMPKIKAWYTYKSQRAALAQSIGNLHPIWFFLSMMLFEYFAEAAPPQEHE
ncbi:MAG TPA: PIG-L family deacetylase [Ktedonobacterales bacterium]|nr:PIG-L family deacetylase [Ktedonobacterales bacterium]